MILLVFAMLYTKEGFAVRSCSSITNCKDCNGNQYCRWNKIYTKSGKSKSGTCINNMSSDNKRSDNKLC